MKSLCANRTARLSVETQQKKIEAAAKKINVAPWLDKAPERVDKYKEAVTVAKKHAAENPYDREEMDIAQHKQRMDYKNLAHKEASREKE